MIPKPSRFKCCHCGYLKKRPGKCVWCGKVADFDNLMGGGVESRHASSSAWQAGLEPCPHGATLAAGNTLMVATIEKRIDSGVRCKPAASEIMLPPSPISPDMPGADGRVGNTANARVTKRDTVTLVARYTHWLR